jgi:hypothetical protein
VFDCRFCKKITSIKYMSKSTKGEYNVENKLTPLINDYRKLINKIGYDKTQKYWPTIEKMKTLGDE